MTNDDLDTEKSDVEAAQATEDAEKAENATADPAKNVEAPAEGAETKTETDEDETDKDEAPESDSEDTSSDDESDESGADSADDKPKRAGWVRYAIIGAVAAVLIGALAVVNILGWQLWREHQVTVAGEQAKATAVSYAQVLTSIDSSNLDENFKQVLDGATGEFKDMYTQSSVQLRQLLVDNKATAQSTIVDSAIQSESRNKVVVLLMIDQSVKNAARPDPRVDRSRMKITMEKVNGRWLASKVELP